MGSYDLTALIGTEIVEHETVTKGVQGRIVRKTTWTVIEAYPQFVKAMRIAENGVEIYTTFNIGTLVTMGAIRLKGVRYIG